jgi:hypothetical protein
MSPPLFGWPEYLLRETKRQIWAGYIDVLSSASRPGGTLIRISKLKRPERPKRPSPLHRGSVVLCDFFEISHLLLLYSIFNLDFVHSVGILSIFFYFCQILEFWGFRIYNFSFFPIFFLGGFIYIGNPAAGLARPS